MILGILKMKVGDILTVDADNLNGFKTGRHIRRDEEGSYPYYKTEEKMNIVKYPHYPEVPLQVDESSFMTDD